MTVRNCCSNKMRKEGKRKKRQKDETSNSRQLDLSILRQPMIACLAVQLWAIAPAVVQWLIQGANVHKTALHCKKGQLGSSRLVIL